MDHACQGGLLKPVFLHTNVQLMPGQSQRLSGFRFVEASVLKRLFDHYALHGMQVRGR